MSDLTASDREILRAVYQRSRDRIARVLDEVLPLQDERRGEVIVALAEISSAIEGYSLAEPTCTVCLSPLDEHDERQTHECTIARLAAQRVEVVKVPAFGDEVDGQCVARDERGTRCVRAAALDRVSLCAGPHDFGPLPDNVRPLRKFAAVVKPRRDLLDVPPQEPQR